MDTHQHFVTTGGLDHRHRSPILALVAGLAIGALVGSDHAPTGSTAGSAHSWQLQAGELRRLADAGAQRELTAEQLRQGLEGAPGAPSRSSAYASRSGAPPTASSVRSFERLATVLAGGASKGRAGEHVLREHLSQLPPGMLTSDFRVNGKVVEFGLVLPDGRRLPIDSKWSAVAELEALEAAGDADRTRPVCAGRREGGDSLARRRSRSTSIRR